MKYLMSGMVVLAVFLTSMASHAITVSCQGKGQALTTTFEATKSGALQADLQFGQEGRLRTLSKKMDVEVMIAPLGTLMNNAEVRVYEGFYMSENLNMGFWISQSFDSAGKMVKELKNIFGMNREQIGSCVVTQGE